MLKNPANLHKAVPLTAKEFHYAFTNTLTEEASQAAYDRYAAPTPAKILFQGGFANVTPHASTTFDFADDDRAPLLFISGGSDHILPPAVQRENYRRNAKHSTAVSAHTVFAGRDHFTCGEPGWEAVAATEPPTSSAVNGAYGAARSNPSLAARSRSSRVTGFARRSRAGPVLRVSASGRTLRGERSLWTGQPRTGGRL